MKTIFQNGMVEDISHILTEDEEFGIQELEDGRGSDKFFYQGDSIKYALDNALVDLYDLFRDHLFTDTDLYYAEIEKIPVFCGFLLCGRPGYMVQSI